MDIKSVFLNGDLQEYIYMNKPKCFEMKGPIKYVHKLREFVMALNKHLKLGMRRLMPSLSTQNLKSA